MAVQLPSIKKNDITNTVTQLPQAEAFGAEAGYNIAMGNIKMVEAADTALANRQKADEKFQLEAQKQVQEARKTRAKSLANQYNAEVDKHTAEFAALPLGGDLTNQYVTIKDSQEKLKEKLRGEAYDAETKALLEQEFSSQDAVLNKAIEVKYAQSNVAYKTRVGKERNGILKRNFIQSSALYDPKDPTSFEELDAALLQMDINTLDYAQAMGLATVDNSGQPVYPDSITKDIRDQKSDAVKLSISSLVGVNDTGRALAIFNRYGNYLNDTDKVTIQNQLTKASNEKQHHTWANQIVNQNPEEQQKTLDTIGTKFGVERKERVGNIVGSLKADRDRIARETNQRRLDEGIKLIEQNQNSPSNRWYTPEEMRKDPKMALIYDKADYQTKKKLDQMIKKPEFSDREAFDQVMSIYQKPDGFKGMTKERLEDLVAPLNQSDTNKMKKRWSQDNGLARTEGLPQNSIAYIRTNVKRQLDEAGMLSESKGFSSFILGSPKQTSTDKNNIFFNKYEDKIINDLAQVNGEYPPNSPQALQLSKELTAKYIKESQQNKKSFFNWFGDDQPKQPPASQPQKVAPKPTLPTITSATTTMTSGTTATSGTSLNDLTPEERAKRRRELLRGTN